MAATSEAAALCAITVTGVAIWEEERVKTSACPLSFSLTHTHTLLPLSLSLRLSLSFSVFTLSAPHAPIHAAFLAVKLHFILLNLNTPGRGQKHVCRAAWHPPWEPLLPLRSLAQQPEELCACCLTWFVLGCWSSMASVLSVAPVSLELCGSPPPRCYSSPPQVCRLHRAAPKPANASPGTHTQLEAQSQGDFKTAGRNSAQIKSLFIFHRTRNQYVDISLSFLLFKLLWLYFSTPALRSFGRTLACQQLWKLFVNCA